MKPTVTQSHVANTITTEEGERFDQDCDLSKGQSDEDAMNDAGEVADFKRDGRNQFEDSSSLNPVTGKATVISLLDFSSIHTKNFYFSWISFCVAFFCWFAFPSIVSPFSAFPTSNHPSIIQSRWSAIIDYKCQK